MYEELISSEMINENDRIAVGVSGGADSMFLLYLLKCKQKEINFYMEAIHINHHLRGEESDNDCKFVVDFCTKNKINVKVIDIDVKQIKKAEKKSLEETARIARFDAIFDEMKTSKLTKLFLAHHANDQAETILMHIFRGSGIGGAIGIRSNNRQIVRPFLSLTKNQILEACEKLNIKYVTDSSNKDNCFTRNYIRNEIIPNIENVYKDAVGRICAFGERCNEILEFISELINPALVENHKHYVLIKGDVFNNKNFIIREYIKIAFEKLDVFSDIESKHYMLISKLDKMQVNSMINLPHEIIAKKTYDGVKLYKKSAEKFFEIEIPFTIGTIKVDGFGKIITEFINLSDISYGDGNQYLDYYKISNNAVWRFRKHGDTFAKLGSGSKKLNDYFTDKKIDVDSRDSIPLLAYQNCIYLVAGYDIGEIAKIDSETDRAVKISIIKE